MAHEEPALEPDPAFDVHYCRNCGEECPDGEDCCTDDFPEPSEIQETGR
jgi:hypothetical protein